MRRSSALFLSLGAVLLIGGCSSTSQHAAGSSSKNVALAGGDNVGRMLHREAPSLAIVATTPSSALAPQFATVPTDADPR